MHYKKHDLLRLHSIYSTKILIAIAVIGVFLICGISFSLYLAHGYSKVFPILFAFVGSIAFLAILFSIYKATTSSSAKKPLSLIVLIEILGLGILSMAIFPPGSVPDEPFHYYNSYYYANQLLGIPGTPDSITVRKCDSDFIKEKFSPRYAPDTKLGIAVDAKGYDYVKDHLFSFEDTQTQAELKKPGATFFSPQGGAFQTRIGTTAGILVGRSLSLNGTQTFYLGRLFNLLLYAFLAFFALRIIPFGTKALAAVVLLPMSINLAASYSYDAVILGLSFLVIALLLRAIHLNAKITKREIAQISITGFLLAPLKIVYTPLLILALFIPAKRFTTKMCGNMFKLCLFAICGISILLYQIPSITNLLISTNASTAALPAASTVSAVPEVPSLLRMITHPLETLYIFSKTISAEGSTLIGTTIGTSLGWFQPSILAPWYIGPVYLLLLFLSAQRFSRESFVVNTRTKCLYCLIALLCFLLILVVFYLSADPNPFSTNHVILGIQGRYFIPFLPLLLLAFRVNRFYYKNDWSLYVPLVFFAVTYCYLIDIYVKAIC